MSLYLPSLDSTNKANIKIIDVLTHQARLFPWIPFYLHTYLPHSKRLNPNLYKHAPKPGYTTQVAHNLYILDSYRDSIYKKIYESQLLRRKRYKYSDLGFYLFQKIIEQETGQHSILLSLKTFMFHWAHTPRASVHCNIFLLGK